MSDSEKYKFNYIGPWGFHPPEPLSEHAPAPPGTNPPYLTSPELQKNGYHVEELNDGIYWVISCGYDTAFVVTDAGVIAIDAPPALGENMLAAIESVTDKPVTHVIYSHWHADHIGAASMYGANVKIIAHETTRELLERFPDPQRPIPNITFAKDYTLELGGVKLELSYKGLNHCPGNIFIYAPKQKVLVAIDIVSPGHTSFMHCDASENISGWLEAHDQILEYDFNYFVGGHITRWGTREDVITAREFFHDMLHYAWEVLEEMSTPEAAQGYIQSVGIDHVWVGVETYINSMANEITKRTLSKITSNGKKWTERLAGATSMTKYHAYSIVESTRLERTHKGYQKKGPIGTNKFIW
jgi:glyoxylase-like metal-dependent hydrolase (beta-lactamase superfamily II)